jgi:hypothetical protein
VSGVIGDAAHGLLRLVPLGRCDDAAFLGGAAGLLNASRRIICHIVGVSCVVETTTVAPSVDSSPASVAR